MSISRRDFLRGMGAGAVCLVGGADVRGQETKIKSKQAGRYNVLMIAVDDLRPELGCYGAKGVISPNIDRLASEGTVFRRAYTMISVCSPSRTCFMTGCRPDTTKVYNLRANFRDTIPDVVTLGQCFMQHGYESVGMGKIYHGNHLNDMASWDKWIDVETEGRWLDKETQKRLRQLVEEAKEKGMSGSKLRRFTKGTATECLDVEDEAYIDGALAETAQGELERLSNPEKRFFLAVGFHKPHLPFIAPKKYWDLYEREKIDLADNPFKPKGSPEGVVDEFPGELKQYYDSRELSEKLLAKGKEHWPEDYARKLIHGYLACVSYVDRQVGKLLDTLKKTGLQEDTIVMLWGDHGWHLGENGTWGKHTNMERGTWSPLILKVPGKKGGQITGRPAEFVDIYPTLVDGCGLKVPGHCEGTSLMPLVDDPKRKWKSGAISQYQKRVEGQRCMGYSIRTEKWRYTQWYAGKKLVASELYDHRSGQGEENENLAEQAQFAQVVEDLSKELRKKIAK